MQDSVKMLFRQKNQKKNPDLSNAGMGDFSAVAHPLFVEEVTVLDALVHRCKVCWEMTC